MLTIRAVADGVDTMNCPRFLLLMLLLSLTVSSCQTSAGEREDQTRALRNGDTP